MSWQDSAKDWVLSPGTIQSLGTLVGTVAGGVAGGPAGAALGTTAGSAVGGLAEGITKTAIAANNAQPPPPATEAAEQSTVPEGVVPARSPEAPSYGSTVNGQVLAIVRDDDGVEWLQLPQPIGVREATLVNIHLQYRKGGRTRRLRYPEE